jgi:hypothetical protein
MMFRSGDKSVMAVHRVWRPPTFWRQFLYTWSAVNAALEETMKEGSVVTLKLNQQQLELIDRTVARGVAPDRAALVRLALREYAAAHASDAAEEAKR